MYYHLHHVITSTNVYTTIYTSDHMFGRAIWDKLPKCIFENFGVVRVKRGLFHNFQKSLGWFILNIARTKYVITG